MNKEFLSIVAITLTLVAYFPYIRSIIIGKTKPHAFSWLIWGATTFVVFLAQLADGAGVGAWPIGVSGLITIYVAALAYAKRADRTITRLDRAFFLAAMASLPFWYFTSDPLWAVVILTAVDVLGFGPTVCRAYGHPFDEQVSFFAIMAARNLVVIGALEHYSPTTVLFPAVVAGAAFLFLAMVMLRRRLIGRPAG